MRFFPRMKARYDYSLLIFILTFALISVSGFREEQVLVLTHKRISTVIIGGLSCVLISIFVCPVWAGQDLHSLLAFNFEKLSFFLLGTSFNHVFFSDLNSITLLRLVWNFRCLVLVRVLPLGHVGKVSNFHTRFHMFVW